jgi:hypothetical protein
MVSAGFKTLPLHNQVMTLGEWGWIIGSKQVIQKALTVLEDIPLPESRPTLLRLYRHYNIASSKRDSGGYVRAAVLRALRNIAQHDDIALIENAAWPDKVDDATPLRSEALIALSELDTNIASFYCVRLLVDQHTSKMSGEPALTAVRVLASIGHYLPLYQFAIQSYDPIPEVLSECLKSLTEIPHVLLHSLIQRYQDAENELVLAGLFDLIVEHESGKDFSEFVTEFLQETRQYELYHYLATTVVAKRKEYWITWLMGLAKDERDPRKVASLIDAFSLIRNEKSARKLIEKLASRI